MAWNWLTGNTAAPDWAKGVMPAPGGQGARSAGEFYSQGAPKMGPPVPERLRKKPVKMGPPVPERLRKKPARSQAPIREVTSAEDRQLRQAMGTSGPMPVGSAGTPMPANPTRQNFWAAEENAHILEAAQRSGEAANKARMDQKLGYLSSGAGLPATSDPSQDAYWQRADMAMWAEANPELAKKQGWDPERNYNASTGGFQLPTDGSEYKADLSMTPNVDPAALAAFGGGMQGLQQTDGLGGMTDEQAYGLSGNPDRFENSEATGVNFNQQRIAPAEVQPAAFNPQGGDDAAAKKAAAMQLNTQVIDNLKANAGYSPREYQYGGEVDGPNLPDEEKFRSQYPWSFN